MTLNPALRPRQKFKASLVYSRFQFRHKNERRYVCGSGEQENHFSAQTGKLTINYSALQSL
jgi:hypothetical protein